MVKDPVCGMDVDESTAQYRHEWEGRTFHFCAEGCMKAFAADPRKYLAEEPRDEGAQTPSG